MCSPDVSSSLNYLLYGNGKIGVDASSKGTQNQLLERQVSFLSKNGFYMAKLSSRLCKVIEIFMQFADITWSCTLYFSSCLSLWGCKLKSGIFIDYCVYEAHVQQFLATEDVINKTAEARGLCQNLIKRLHGSGDVISSLNCWRHITECWQSEAI